MPQPQSLTVPSLPGTTNYREPHLWSGDVLWPSGILYGEILVWFPTKEYKISVTRGSAISRSLCSRCCDQEIALGSLWTKALTTQFYHLSWWLLNLIVHRTHLGYLSNTRVNPRRFWLSRLGSTDLCILQALSPLLPKVILQQVFHKLRSSNKKLSFLPGFPLLPWPPCWRADLPLSDKGLNCVWSPPALGLPTATSRFSFAWDVRSLDKGPLFLQPL